MSASEAPEFDPEAFKRWTPKAQEEALAILERLRKPVRIWYCQRGPVCDGHPHDDVPYEHARADQWPPVKRKEWLTWMLMGGRGSGKTKAGSEYVRKSTDRIGRIALIGPTSADVRETMIEGVSGLIVACENAHMDYKFEPSKRRFTFGNGAIAQLFSAEEPDRLRGPQFGLGWLDEPAHYPDPDEVWSMFMFGLRMGKHPHAVVTTTPLPNAWNKRIAADEGTVISRVSTYDNAANLPPSFLEEMKQKYEGTRLGRQELHGEILLDVEGALWKWEMIDAARMRETDPQALAKEMDRVVVAIDPAGTSTKRSDETGIVVMGKKGLDLYLLADLSGRYTPERWARKAVDAYADWEADVIVVENNYGGEMVRATLANISAYPKVKEVNSRRGKFIRAEPVAALYEQARVHHVGAGFPALETQLTEWIPGEGKSPDRLDALVHGAHELVDISRPATIATALGRTLPRRLRKGAPISVVPVRPTVRSWA